MIVGPKSDVSGARETERMETRGQASPEPDRRMLPALPGSDEPLGEIRWDSWESAPEPSHLASSCPTCAFPGPLSMAFGRTEYTPETDVHVQRSAPDQASQWVRARGESYWCRTHWAVRCPQCDEMRIYWMATWEQILCRPPTTERAVPPTSDNVLF